MSVVAIESSQILSDSDVRLDGVRSDSVHDGTLVLTPEDTAIAESLRADFEHQRNEKLIAKLRELGVEPD